jgi:hypothetical protein
MFSFGTDPEFIIEDHEGNIRSAIDIIKNSKDRPIVKEGHRFYYDNVMAEFAIKPAFSKQEAVGHIRTALRYLTNMLPSGHQISPVSSRIFPKTELKTQEAFKVGCKEEFCAYTLDTVDLSVEIPKEVKEKEGHLYFCTNLRTAGGHVHAGAEVLTNESVRIMFIRMMDFFLGIPSIYMNQDESAKIRKQLYGKAGRYRKPNHGAEYRSMGNYWLTSPQLVELVYDLTKFTTEFVAEEKHNDFWHVDVNRLQSDDFWNNDGDPSNCHFCTGYDAAKKVEAINTMNPHLAQPLMDRVRDVLPSCIMEQIDAAIERPPTDLYRNWEL